MNLDFDKALVYKKQPSGYESDTKEAFKLIVDPDKFWLVDENDISNAYFTWYIDWQGGPKPMPSFSARSKKQYETLHENLQKILASAIQYVDFTIVEGHRSNEDQERAFREGKSKLLAGKSKHNLLPSQAVDIYPYPINFKQMERFYYLAGVIFTCAAQLGIKIRWGGDWDGDKDFYDQKFMDLPHFELI